MLTEKRLGFLVFILSFLVYAVTLCPTISSGDSAELITAAYTLGVPHAPGYPLYCLFGKLFSFIPLGGIALRVNLMSAFFAALSVTVIYFIIILLIKALNPEVTLINRFLPALVASLAFAYGETFWSQAVVAEVYTVFVFFIALSFYILLRWTRESEKIGLLYWFSFFYGLAVTCHQLGLFFAPGFFLLILFYRPKIFLKPKDILMMLLLFASGLAVYLYIPIRAMSNPPLNWNKVYNLDGFIDYLTRRQYGEVRENYNIDYFVKRFYIVDFAHFKELLYFLEEEFKLIWMLGFFGSIPLILKARRYLLAFIAIFMMAVVKIWMAVPYADKALYIGRVYLLGGFIIIAVMLGLSFFYFLEAALKCRRKFFYYLTLFIIALLPVILLSANYAKNDQSENYIIYDYGKNTLDTLEKGAVLLADGDNILFSLLYLTVVEKARPDVTIYDDIAGDVFSGTPFFLCGMSAKDKTNLVSGILAENKRPLYITFGNPLVPLIKQRTELVGIAYRVLKEEERTGSRLRGKYWQSYLMRGVFEDNLLNKDFLTREVISSYHIALGSYLLAFSESLGIDLFRRAAEISRDSKFIQQTLAMSLSLEGRHSEAIGIFKKNADSVFGDATDYYNLAVAYAKSGKYNEAITGWSRALELKPDFKISEEYIKKAKELLRKSKPSPRVKEKKAENFKY